jgi:hypothetical protein
MVPKFSIPTDPLRHVVSTKPIFPEWLCALSLLVWVFAHGIILG